MNELHLVMQRKGGVGKSVVACHLAQFLKAKNNDTICIDTDSLTPTLFRYQALSTVHIQIADQAKIHLEKFDEMIEIIAGTQGDVVIDTGSSTFLPISSYLINDNIFELLAQNFQKKIVVHVVINAQTENDYLSTIAGLQSIGALFPDFVSIVVWLNEFGGPIRSFEKTQIYHDIKHRIYAIISMKNPDELALKDYSAMQAEFLTYAEAIERPSTKLVSKSRLHRLRQGVFGQLEHILPLSN